MAAALHYAADRLETKQPFADYMQRVAAEPASATLHDEPFFLKPPYRLTRHAGARPLAVLFERTHCSSCEELHREAANLTDIAGLNDIRPIDVIPFGERALPHLLDSGMGIFERIKFDGRSREAESLHAASMVEMAMGDDHILDIADA